MKSVSDKTVEKIKIRILCSATFSKSRAVNEITWKKWYMQAGHKWQYDACALRAGWVRLQTFTQNM